MIYLTSKIAKLVCTLKETSRRNASNESLVEYSDAQVYAVLDVINTIVACLLPTSSIIMLYLVSSLPTRLGIIVAYEVLSSLCLALFTQARGESRYLAPLQGRRDLRLS